MTAQINESTRLSGVFYAPNYNEMLPFMIDAHKSFKYKSDASSEKILMRIIARYWSEYNEHCRLAQADESQYRHQGDFNLGGMLQEIAKFTKLVTLADQMKRKFVGTSVGINGVAKLGFCGVKHLYSPCKCTHENESVFAVALGSEIIHTIDKDCYETAGGYRSYESNDKPIVYLSVGHYGISLIVESWLTVDHYNNNICGVSTGNGTRTYDKSGKSVNRIINTMSYDLGEVLEKYNLTLKKMDCERGLNQLNQYDI